MQGSNRRFTLAATALPLLFLAMSGLSRAATITVTTRADPTGARGTCSLRQAITNANGQNTAGSTNCSAGSGNNDQIIFASGLTGTITLGSTLPPITDTNLAIIGPTGSPGITISGGGKVQLINIPAATSRAGPTLFPILNLQLLTLTNGNSSSAEGGAINNGGTLNVTNCTFSHNQAADGGAIASEGHLNVSNSTFSDNQAGGYCGGAITSQGLGWASYVIFDTVTNSTFSGNTAFSGSAICSEFLQVSNCTFSGNHATATNGGAVCTSRSTIKDSIVANNIGTNCECGSTGITPSAGYNISDDGTCGFGHSTGANGLTIGDNVNPYLAPGLANNGGPTETIALLGGSPAIAVVPLSQCTAGTDQRGSPRPAPGDNACDIGAYEFQGPPPPPPPRCPPGEGWTESASGYQCHAIPKCPAACKNGCFVVPAGVPPNNKPGNSKPIFACKNAQGGIGTFNQQ